MNYCKLGKSDVAVSEISLGCWTMVGLNRVDGRPNGLANVNEDEIAAAVKRAVDAGVNHFDNTDVYGNVLAERQVACHLAAVSRKLSTEDMTFIDWLFAPKPA